ncbi:hypothetical protein JMN32_05295 [Fulvivirga sp. 29W222]|uniref:Uncharacterized protein n=1 Tax=Fulvivirga marina TaxID=2494733 RepID=A0A937KCZ7_9BACT|nr:hypothetical protein [Fulvivirga marina]MBL6445713.1 hypothetical protein [Fulvivirga marina]
MQRIDNKNQESKTMIFWVLVTFGALVFCSLLVVALVYSSFKGYLYGTNGVFVRYGISIVLGLSSAAFLIGGLKANAAVRGKKFGMAIELGGGAAIAALVIWGSIYSTKQTEFTQGFYLFNSSTNKPIDNQELSLTAMLPNGPQTVMVGAEGYIEFKNLPNKLLGAEVELSIPVEGYNLPDTINSLIFNGETRKIMLLRDNSAMLRFKKSVAYEFIRLIIPLRIMADDAFGNYSELPFANFNRDELINTLAEIPISTNPGDLTLPELQRMFVYVSDEPIYKTELVKSKGTYAERLAGAAMRFTEFYTNFSQLERNYLSDKELNLIHEVRHTLFIERMKNLIGMKISNDETLIPVELEGLFSALVNAEEEMGPFEMYFVTF